MFVYALIGRSEAEDQRLAQLQQQQQTRVASESVDPMLSLPRESYVISRVVALVIDLSAKGLTRAFGTQYNSAQLIIAKDAVNLFFTRCFHGLLITLTTMVVFIAIFILRDWILNNEPILEDQLDDEEVIPGHAFAPENLNQPQWPLQPPPPPQQQQQYLRAAPAAEGDMLGRALRQDQVPRTSTRIDGIQGGEQGIGPADGEKSKEAARDSDSEGETETDGLDYKGKKPEALSRRSDDHDTSQGQRSGGLVVDQPPARHADGSLIGDHRRPEVAGHDWNDEPQQVYARPIEQPVFEDDYHHHREPPRHQPQPDVQQPLEPIVEQAPQIPPQPPLPPRMNDGDENPENFPIHEFDENAFEGEGIDNIIEAMGFNGPLANAVQYFILVIFVVSMVLAIGVWVPYVLGKLVLRLNFVAVLEYLLNSAGALKQFVLESAAGYYAWYTVSMAFLVFDYLSDLVVDAFFVVASVMSAIYSVVTLVAAKTVLTPAVLLARLTVNAAQPILGRVLSIFLSDIDVSSKGADPLWDQLVGSRHLRARWGGLTSKMTLGLVDSGSSISGETPLPVAAALSPGAIASKVIGAASTGWNRSLSSTRALCEWLFDIGITDTFSSRFIAIVVGHVVLTLFAIAYARLGRGRNLPGQRSVSMALAMTKVFMFMVIELVAFPIMCGCAIDLATIPLFPGATLSARWEYTCRNPLTSTFLHWFIGTFFMFNFSGFVSMCRSTLRPGVMWFIRDPNDPHFHPIREIFERKVTSQLRKIGISAVMYIAIIVVGFGAVFWSVYYLAPSVFPLRWNMSLPISAVPYDLLVLHFVLPPLFVSLRLGPALFAVFKGWWAWSAAKFRLSEFLLGRPVWDEMGHWVRNSWQGWLFKPPTEIVNNAWERAMNRNEDRQDASKLTKAELRPEVQHEIDEMLRDCPHLDYVLDGYWMRVPAFDSVPVAPGRKMLVPLDDKERPVDPAHDYGAMEAASQGRKEEREEEEEEQQQQQQPPHPRRRGARDFSFKSEDYQVIYVPPNFYLRLVLFMVWSWMTLIAVVMYVMVMSVVVGRRIYEKYGVRVEHDAYSLFLGLSVVGVGTAGLHYAVRVLRYLLSSTVQWQDVRQSAIDKATIVAKVVGVVIVYGGVVPFALGCGLEVGVVRPMRFFMGQRLPFVQQRPVVEGLVQNWAVSLLYVKIVYRILTLIPESHYGGKLQECFGGEAGVREWRVVESFRVFAVPAVTGSISFAVVPYLVALVCTVPQWKSGVQYGMDTLFVGPTLPYYVYPMTSLVCIAGIILHSLGKLYIRWVNAIRDQEYLVGQELQNFEEESGVAAAAPTQADDGNELGGGLARDEGDAKAGSISGVVTTMADAATGNNARTTGFGDDNNVAVAATDDAAADGDDNDESGGEPETTA
ncbi:hypothetical protein EV182_000427 [Spiromyces aspiralis]|uniref:Uncharacterized protein n=1 Tax=Spiromyces aspiralis TaxID=68401 RepID=A0ACC1HY12_9FUNG|nr:hypothetical protein EV182_000427 [Spiromyces aspiralis]